MLRYCPFSCTCRLTSCSATVRSLALVHTHTSCYSTVRSLAHRRAIFYLPTQTRIGVGLGGATTFTCARTGHATLKMC